MTAVTIKSNKIVSNEVEDNLVLPELSQGKKKAKTTVWPMQYTGNEKSR